MLWTSILITALVVAGTIVWSRLKTDDGTGPSRTEWDAVALVDRPTGTVVTFDADGRPLTTIAGDTRVVDVHTFGRRLALVSLTAITLVDPLAEPATAPTVVPIPSGSTVTALETPASLHLVVGNPEGGNLLIVDVTDASVLDVAALSAPTTPKVFGDGVRTDATGTRFAIADSANFQTIVVGDDLDRAVFLADQPVAVGETLVATSQTVDVQADVALVALDRTVAAIAPTDVPRGGVMVGDRLVMVSVDGGVFRIGPGDDEAERIASVPVPSGRSVSWVLPAGSGTVIVVGGPGFEAVVALDGTVVTSTVSANEGEPVPARPGWRCAPLGPAALAESIVSLDTGEVVADLTGFAVTHVSADGCAVVGQRAGAAEVIGAAGRAALGSVVGAAVAPGGNAVVRTTGSGSELVPVDGDELGEPVVLTAAPVEPIVAFLAD